jgi:hypothetical protein
METCRIPAAFHDGYGSSLGEARASRGILTPSRSQLRRQPTVMGKLGSAAHSCSELS